MRLQSWLKKIKCIVFIIASMLSWGVKAEKISALDSRVQWEGHCVMSNDAVSLGYTLEGFKVAFRGTAISIDCERSENTYLCVVLDGNRLSDVRADKSNIVLAENLSDTIHVAEVYKLTEYQTGILTIHSINVSGGTLLVQPQDKRKHIEFIGNSITCGYGNRGNYSPENALTGFHPELEDGYMSWGAMISRELNMRYSAVASSGRGLMFNNNGSTDGIVPLLYDEAIEKSMTKITPDIVVVNLGTNDFFALGQGSVNFSMGEFAEAYKHFIKSIRKRFPKAKIVCVTGPMMSDDYPAGEQHLTKIIKATNDAVKGMKNVFRIDFSPQNPPFGEDFHPTIDTHREMCNKFIKAIQ